MKILRWIGAGIGIVLLIYYVLLILDFQIGGTGLSQFMGGYLFINNYLFLIFLLIAIIYLMIRDKRINIIIKRLIGSIGMLYFLFIAFVLVLNQQRHLLDRWALEFLHTTTGSFPMRIGHTRVDLVILLGFIYVIIAIVYLLFWDWFARSKEKAEEYHP